MRKLTATLIVSLIGLIALSVSTTAVACGGDSGSQLFERRSDRLARMRRVRTKKGLHLTMKAFYFWRLFRGAIQLTCRLPLSARSRSRSS